MESAPSAICSSCGGALEDEARFCGMCGRRQTTRIHAAAVAAPPPALGHMLLVELMQSDTLLDWRSAFELLVALCRTVADARARGIEQLALAPESFYVERGEHGWSASLLDEEVEDFRRAEPKDTDVMRTPPGWLVVPSGLDYFSPEKLLGKPLDGAHEVYALALFAYELVAGRRPFQDAAGTAGLITAMLKQSPPPPSRHAPDAGIPAAVDALLLHGLDKDRTRRIANAAALATAASAVLAGEPIAPPKLVKRTITAKPTRKRTNPALHPPARRATLIEVFPARTCGATCTVGHRFGVSANRTLVGSWLYLDHLDSDVAHRTAERAHPHAGVATVSYLFDGRLEHRDSLGNVQMIERGGVSWLYAGRGVVHSEKQPEMVKPAPLHGLQLWLALPRPNEDDDPAYVYHGAADLPSVVIGGVRVRVVLGEGFGAKSPLETPSPVSLFDARIPAGAAMPMPQPRYHDYQRAVYVVSGEVLVGKTVVPARHLAVLTPDASVGVTASGDQPAHVIGLASAPCLGPRHNSGFFSSSVKGRIADAKQRWAAGELGSVPGEPA